MLAFKSDWLYPAYQSQEIVKACKLAGVEASYCEINSTYGHDSFLLETEQETQLIGGFLKAVANGNGSEPHMTKQTHAIEHKVISSWISSGASVLDLGCGDGELLSLLIRNKQVHAQGVELSEQAIHNCVAAGLSVFQQDIDTGLTEYADKSVDYVILNQTLATSQETRFCHKRSFARRQKSHRWLPKLLLHHRPLPNFLSRKSSRYPIFALRMVRYA